MSDQPVPSTTWFLDPGGPADEERDAVPAFIDIAFTSAIDVTAVVAEFFNAFLPRIFRPVVTREHNKRIFVQSLLLQEGKDATDVVIGFDDKFTIGTTPSLAVEFGQGTDRVVW